MCTKKREWLNILISGERGLNIIIIKIHLESNSNSPCVGSTVANLFYFLQFGEVVGANFCGFALQA